MKRDRFIIRDSVKDRQVNGEIVVEYGAISIYFDGFGSFVADDVSSVPVFIELHNEELSVYVMRDKYDKQPVKVVLNGARIVKGD